ncbi:MAG: PAS domain S-box [Nitrospirae bacterium]|nr:MAG: PAS domain S-box [Nitrospirota bacterium]
MSDMNPRRNATVDDDVDLQRKIDELTALNKIVHATSDSLDPHEIVNAALAEVLHLINPDLSMVFLAEGSDLVPVGTVHAGREQGNADIPRHRIGECLCGLAVSAGEEIYSIDILNDPRCTWHECRNMGMRSAATLPLRDRAEILGVLVLASRSSRDFGQQHDFLETLSGHLALCLRNAILFRQLQSQLVKEHSLISDRNHLQSELARNEERLRLVMDATSDGLWDWNPVTDRTYFSPAYYRMLGYKTDEFPMTGSSWLERIHPDDREEALRKNIDCMEARIPKFQAEFRMKTKDGGWKWILSRGKVVQTDAGGRAVRMSGTHVDITERKLSEAALQESERKFRFLVENAPAVFFMLDDDGIFLLSEGQALSRIGLAPGQVVGMSALEIYRDNPSIASSIRVALNGEIVRSINHINEIIFDTIYAPYSDSAGLRKGVIGVAVDVTEQKKLQTQLLRAQKMEAIGTLAGGIAHDFNNLLTNILGYTSLLLHETQNNHPHYRRLKNIETQIASATELTKRLLGFARGGKYEVKPTDLNELVSASSEMFSRTKKEISVTRRLGAGLHSAEVDSVQIEQVLMNLYVNAWQAMPHGGSLFLSTENVVLDDRYCRHHGIEQGAYVKVSVSDTGTGMDEETQSRVFEPFFTTKGTGVGTGLGLASAYGIIRNHGGTINVYSELGKGTTFTFYLPASRKTPARAEPVSKGLVAGVGTILLVDDQGIVSEVGREMLSILGYDPLIAGSGEEAIALYAENRDRILLVILDMIMPGMSGSETFDRLKQIDPGVQVILSSGYSINGQASDILNKGCRGFIQKPFNLQDLSKKIQQSIRQQDDHPASAG